MDLIQYTDIGCCFCQTVREELFFGVSASRCALRYSGLASLVAVSAAMTRSARSVGDCFPFFRSRGDDEEEAGAALWLPPRFGVGVLSFKFFAARFAGGGVTATAAAAAEVDEEDEDEEEDSECFSRLFRIPAVEGKSAPVLGKS